jgi:cysteine/O-acetylserine efflux protein
MQFINPKVIFFGLTIFTSFLNPLTGNMVLLGAAAVALSGWVFLMNSFWAGAGSVIFNYFDNPIVKRVFSLTIAAMLVYAALNIFGFFEYLETLS